MSWWQAVAGARTVGEPPVVSDLTHDSRLVGANGAFIAVPGGRYDGHDYLDAAVANGARALVVQADREAKWGSFLGRVPLVIVPDTRAAVGTLAAAVHDNPSAKLRIVGLTGTDGKTTTTHLAAHVLGACGLGSGYLSSVGFDTGGGFVANESHMTTVEATVIQRLLAEAVASGRQTMVVEASSEGLAQHRIAGCEIDVAVFTNLTRDHLDFHGTMENYLAAKGLLFEMLSLPTTKTFWREAVVNADDAASAYLREITRVPLRTYGRSAGVDFRAVDVEVSDFGLVFTVEAGSERVAARAPLRGEFNVLNCLATVAVACGQGVPLAGAVDALSSFTGVPGRLELIDCGQPFRVYVDIASTPAALENVLNALRPATRGRLWAVFGAAGGRDPARRDGMGRVAGRLADRAVLTNEDPRDEDPDAIIEAIASGLREMGRKDGSDFVRRPERREALRYAFENAEPGDTILLAGKATETTMIIGGRAVPWDERATARELLQGRSTPG